ncbi:uncharacterized protein LOC124313856 isoform X2 [Daphnia pulicaria]|uniref:uncharacterized protein LOC124313856 isoform X2 n=1 Tax=Daphnia pulicaria TaxID=35523 RepID=UPI001EEAEF10|nr:uncharacterized protein LOC124313856 isoform X2 [Daphnia pulicaria]
MGRELSGWLFMASFIIGFFSCAASASEKDKLMTWIHENSDMFVMLKHWNDLPLISTAWKRLKMTPQVQEDRKNFVKSVETFLEILGDDLQIQRPKNVSSIYDNQTLVNGTFEVAPLPQIPSVIDFKDNTGALVNATLVLESSKKEVEPTTNSSASQFSKDDKTLIVQTQTSSIPCSCNDSLQFDSKSFLRDYEEEKRWMRSQLIPLNYLFDKLRVIEDRFTNLQRTAWTCLNANEAKNETTNNVTSNTNVATSNLGLQSRIENLESLSKTFSVEYQNLTAMVMSVQETAKATTEHLEILSSRVSDLAVSKSALYERNNTEDVEYCPEHLDERVPCAEVGNSCYCFSKLQRNWTAAQEFCRKNDMFLLSLETQNETELINNHIKNSGLPKDFYWTSGSDEAKEGQWIWTSTQENITVTNWRNNQPDGGKKENCLYLHSRDEFKWGDWMCNLSQYFICEWLLC